MIQDNYISQRPHHQEASLVKSSHSCNYTVYLNTTIYIDPMCTKCPVKNRLNIKFAVALKRVFHKQAYYYKSETVGKCINMFTIPDGSQVTAKKSEH
jgi:hypothetical protein